MTCLFQILRKDCCDAKSGPFKIILTVQCLLLVAGLGLQAKGTASSAESHPVVLLSRFKFYCFFNSENLLLGGFMLHSENKFLDCSRMFLLVFPKIRLLHTNFLTFTRENELKVKLDALTTNG